MSRPGRVTATSVLDLLRLLGLAAVLCSLLLVSASSFPQQASAQSISHEQAFIASINRVRAENGLPALIVESQLTAASRGWTRQQADLGCPDPAPPGGSIYICHSSEISSGITHKWATIGENVGTGVAVDGIMDAFVASPSHFANIVDPSFTHVGVGVVSEGGRLTTTHRFMALRSAATLAGSEVATPTTAAPTTTSTTTTTTTTTTTSTIPTTTTTAAPIVTTTAAAAAVAAPTTPATTTTAPTTTAPATTEPTATPPDTTATLAVEPRSSLSTQAVNSARAAAPAAISSGRANNSLATNSVPNAGGDAGNDADQRATQDTEGSTPISNAGSNEESPDATRDEGLDESTEDDSGAAGAGDVPLTINIGTDRVNVLLGALNAFS